MARYRFVTELRLAAPVEAVYRALVEPERWVDHWGDLGTLERTAAGDHDGLGASFEASVRAPVGYRLGARIEVVAVQPPTAVQVRASGDLEGEGCWRLRGDQLGTLARLDWSVRVTRWWMVVLSPLARPVFVRSHGVVVRHAAEAVAAGLDAPLRGFRSAAVR